ncbi:Outer membrane receptor protein, mostly Fe transport [Snodgrassella alvi SCGC AB-598-O02]|nr:TonB-dependent siderophore receptor [Snodgrassella alvi]KES09512.1 Outer membrane receptor protein, mostly Fe transport [Snodgrassella alvi SCGC AB-598-O02]
MRKHNYQLKKKHFSAIKLRLKNALNPLISSRKNLILSITTGVILINTPVVYGKEDDKNKPTVKKDAANANQSGEATLPDVNVQAYRSNTYAGGQISTHSHLGFLGNKSYLDTPFNTTSYTDKYVENTQARNITDVIAATDPSVFTNGAVGGWSENYYIRGFQSDTNDMSMNGLFGISPFYRTAPAMFSRVEVLKGPSALLNGMPPSGSVAGTVNLVTKRAGEEPLLRVSPTYMSSSQWGGTIDASRRFGQNKQFGIRINGVYQDGSGPVRKQDLKTQLGSVGMDWRGQRARVSADLYMANDRVDGVVRGINLGKNMKVPSPPNPKTLINPDWSYVSNKDRGAMMRAEYDLTDNITAYATFGYSKSKYEYNGATTANLLDNRGTIETVIGQLAFDLNKRSADIGLKGQFDTGPVGHQWVINTTYYKHHQHDYGVRRVAGANWITNMYDPKWGESVPFNTPPISVSSLELKSYGMADMLSFMEDKLQLTLGLRYQEVKSDNTSLMGSPVTTSYNKHALTPGAAILFKATEHVSLYGNYIEGLTKGDSAPIYAENYPEVFAPYKTKQTELGIKLDYGNIVNSISIFNIKKPSSYTDVNTNIFTSGGEQRNRGIEWNFIFSPIDTVRLMGGASYIKPELTKLANHANEGNIATGVAKIQGKLGAEWDIHAGAGMVTLSANATAVSKQYLNQENNLSVPGHTIFDVGARYNAKVSGHPFTLRAEVKNLTNKAYWGMPRLSNLSLGAPRTFLFSGSYDF